MTRLLPLLLTGCAPLLVDVERTQFVVNVAQMPQAEVQAECRALGAQTEQTIVGCSQYLNGTLYMMVTPPVHMGDARAFEIIGHELWHGVKGKFHE